MDRANAAWGTAKPGCHSNDSNDRATPSIMPELQAMASAVQQHATANSLLTNCDVAAVGASAFWLDAVTGDLCRCRPHFWRADGILVDVRISDDINPADCINSEAGKAYHARAAWCLDGMKGAHRAGHFPADWAEPTGFIFLAVSRAAPHNVTSYSLTDEDETKGRQRNQAYLYKWAAGRLASNPTWAETWARHPILKNM